MRNQLLLTFIVVSLAMPLARSEETGSGHYTPGGMASFIDTLPSQPGLAVGNYFTYYDASTSGQRPLAFGGLITYDANAQAYSDSVLVMYNTGVKLLGGAYTPAVCFPYVWLEVDGKVDSPLGIVPMSDRADGIGDIMVYPVMFAWSKGDLKYDLRLGVYTPSGDYEEFRLANIGKNYWTFEPAVSVSWLSSKIGLELSAFAGVDFSTENEDTDYQSGDVFHIDATVAEHLPLGKNFVVGVGASAFYYQQITGDSWHGAPAGEFEGFEGRTVGVGPVLSLLTKVCGKDLVAEVKWLPELDVEKRLKGDYVWVKLGMAF